MEVIGRLQVDLCQQDRLFLNGVHRSFGDAENERRFVSIHSFGRSVVKTYALTKGHFAFITDDLFQLIVGLMDSEAVHRSYFKNLFNFKNMNCNYSGFFVSTLSASSIRL